MATDPHVELLARLLFALRRLDNGQPSTAERLLRSMLSEWFTDPKTGVDVRALAPAAEALRRRPEPECQVWADLVDAIHSGNEDALLAARYRCGESSQVLARESGVSDTTMLARLHRQGVVIRRQGGAMYDDDTKARAVAMYLAGTPSRDVAAEFGTAKNVIIKWVREAGGEVRRPRERRPADAT